MTDQNLCSTDKAVFKGKHRLNAYMRKKKG